MKWYRIESSRTLLHNGKRYEGGQIVKLDDVAARLLLDLGAIFECDPPEAEAEAEREHKPEVEAGAKRGRKREIEARSQAKAATRRRGRPRR